MLEETLESVKVVFQEAGCVLETDIESRNQLEGSVSTIIERLTTGNPKKLDAEAEQLAAQRTELLAQLRKHRQDLFEARADEYRDVVFLKTKLTPIEAARKVAAEAQSHAWIPGSIKPGAPLPLSAAEIDELYASTEALSVEDESELARLLPELKALVSPDEFEKIAEEHARLSKESRNYRPELWKAPLDAPLSAALDKLLAKAVKAVEALDRERRWKIAAVAAGNEGGTARVEWDELVKMLDELIEQTADAKESALRHAPVLSGKIPLEEQRQITEEILAYFKKNKSVGKIALLTHGAWKRFIGETRVASGEPKSATHFQALRGHILLAIMRRDLGGRWDRQMVPQGAPAWAGLSEKPLEDIAHFAKEIRRCLCWHAEEWQPVENELKERGFLWREFFGEQRGDATGLLHRLKELVSVQLPQAFQARKDTARFGEVDARFRDLRSALTVPKDATPAPVLAKLARAAERLSPSDYRDAYQRMVQLEGQRKTAASRRELLAALQSFAPGERKCGGPLPSSSRPWWVGSTWSDGSAREWESAFPA